MRQGGERLEDKLAELWGVDAEKLVRLHEDNPLHVYCRLVDAGGQL